MESSQCQPRFATFFIAAFFIAQLFYYQTFLLSLPSMYRRSPAVSGHLFHYPHFHNICQAGPEFCIAYFSVNVAQAVSLQSQAPHPLMST